MAGQETEQHPITHEQIEKAARELVNAENGKPAPFQAIVNGMKLRRQVSDDYQPKVDFAKIRLRGAKLNATKWVVDEAFDEQRSEIDVRYREAIVAISAEIDKINDQLSEYQRNYAENKENLDGLRQEERDLKSDKDRRVAVLEKNRDTRSKIAKSLQKSGYDGANFNDRVAYYEQRIADTEFDLEENNISQYELALVLDAIDSDIQNLQEQLAVQRREEQRMRSEWDQKLSELRDTIQKKRMVELTNARINLEQAREERDSALSRARHAVTVTCAREFADKGKSAAYRVGSGAETAGRTTYEFGKGIVDAFAVPFIHAAEGYQQETTGQKRREQLEQQRQQQQLSASDGPR